MTTKRSNEQMQKVEVIIHIDTPSEAVWAYMADLPFVRALPFTTMEVIGEPVNVGTVNRLTFALPFGVIFRFDELVTEWVENERIAYRAISGWAMEAEAVLKPEDGGTCFRFTLHYRFPGLWKLTPHWLMKLGCRQGLKNLRRMIETKPRKGGVENAHPTEFH